MTNKSSRRNFLKYAGITAGATIMATPAIAVFTIPDEIKKLTGEQQAFMIEYGTWMDEFIEVIRMQKSDPGNAENQKRMIGLTHRAEEFKPRLTEFMKDDTFSLIYRASIERMSKEI